MPSSLTRSQAFRQLLIFSVPIILGQVGIMLIGTGDMIIAGRYSRECLAAIGLAISVANPIMISLLGMQFSISPLLAQKLGRGETVSEYFWTVILYSILVSIVSCAITLLSLEFIPLFGYGDTTTRLMREYLLITSFSTLGLCLYQGVKEFLQAQEKTLSANFIALVAVGVNLVFNYVLVFGEFGAPKLNEAGLAWASLGVRLFMGLGLFAFTSKYWVGKIRIDWKFMGEIFKLGLPITLTLFFEILAFCSVTLFIGKFAEVQTAANNLALNLGSLAFMIPLSISAAVAVKVGHAYGEKKRAEIQTFNEVSLMFAVGFAITTGLIFYFAPLPILKLYTSDAEVLAWATKLLFWVACFQLFDGTQVTLAGILRGLSVTRASSIAVFIGYWLIGIPLGYYLGFHRSLEAQGFWIGLAVSLALVAVMLAGVLNRQMRQLKL